MTASRYCSPCSIAWPNTSTYAKCPGCSAPTSVSPGLVPLGLEEAKGKAMDLTQSRTNHEAFERYYDEHRIQPEVEKFAAELSDFNRRAVST